MRPSTPLWAVALLLASPDLVAQATSERLLPVSSPVRDAGTYHLSTGAWTRAQASVAFSGPEVLYDNTCTTGYFNGLDPGQGMVDSGRLPSVASGGLADVYSINGFETAYCSYESSPITIQVSFWDCYESCDDVYDLPSTPPVAQFALSGMPAGGPSGSQGCWVVSIDLTNTSLDFTLGGDCDGALDGDSSLDNFTWIWTVPGGTTGTVGSGPQLGGDPAQAFNPSCGGVGDGTTFPGYDPALPGTGLGNLDQFTVLPCTTFVCGCYWFGGYSGANGASTPGSNPWSGYYLELLGEGLPPPNTGTSTCDAAGGHCPCTSNGLAGSGCPNSFGPGARLVGSGNAAVTDDSFELTVEAAAAGKPGLVLAGTVDLSPGISSVPDSAGLLCVGGSTARGEVVFTDAQGAAPLPTFQGGLYGQAANVTPGSTAVYTFWYRDPGTACAPNDTPAADFNFSNAWSVTWH